MRQERRVTHTVPEGTDIARAIRWGKPLTATCGTTWVPIAEGDACDQFPPCPKCKTKDAPVKRNVPKRKLVPTFVYRCYDASSRLIYVGCTVTPRTRMDAHRATSWWFPQVARTRYIVFPDREYALTRERQAIAEEQPRWNIKGRWQHRALWVADDYADYYTAVLNTPSSGTQTQKHLALVADEAMRRYGLALDAEEMTA